jgi:hypothetical protein
VRANTAHSGPLGNENGISRLDLAKIWRGCTRYEREVDERSNRAVAAAEVDLEMEMAMLGKGKGSGDTPAK